MITAVIDSCIIFGMLLCDTLLRAAEDNLYQIVLSQKIVADATRNMVLKGRLKLEKEAYYQQQIQNAFPDNFFDAPSEIVASTTNAETDRHVAATAIISQAKYIVTFNLKDFPPKSLRAHNIEAIHPDQFLELLCDDWGESRLYEIISQQSNTLKNPRISPEALLDKLAIQKCLRFRSRIIDTLPQSNIT
jgi:predicted nucleic acid-binding protein